MTPTFPLRGRRAFLAMAAAVPLQSLGLSAPPAGVMAALRRACEALDELALEDVVTPDVTFADPTRHLACRGFDAMRPMIADVKRLARAIRIEIDQELVCGAWVITRQVRVVVPHTTPDRPINIPAVSLVRVEGGRIAEWYDYSGQLPPGKSAELP